VADETLGARIRRLRVVRGMTQYQLAEACAAYGRRVERTNVQRWEYGEHVPTVANFAALARVLGVSIDVLFYGEEEAPRIEAERRAMGPIL
jgi:transcriptional regulator with XRE-family HTH domain